MDQRIEAFLADPTNLDDLPAMEHNGSTWRSSTSRE